MTMNSEHDFYDEFSHLNEGLYKFTIFWEPILSNMKPVPQDKYDNFVQRLDEFLGDSSQVYEFRELLKKYNCISFSYVFTLLYYSQKSATQIRQFYEQMNDIGSNYLRKVVSVHYPSAHANMYNHPEVQEWVHEEGRNENRRLSIQNMQGWYALNVKLYQHHVVFTHNQLFISSTVDGKIPNAHYHEIPWNAFNAYHMIFERIFEIKLKANILGILPHQNYLLNLIKRIQHSFSLFPVQRYGHDLRRRDVPFLFQFFFQYVTNSQVTLHLNEQNSHVLSFPQYNIEINLFTEIQEIELEEDEDDLQLTLQQLRFMGDTDDDEKD